MGETGQKPCGAGAGEAAGPGSGGRQETGMLSERLQMLADMVTPGNRLADVGCDHGYLAIYLVRAGICPRAVAMDVREGPLAAARRHVEEAGLEDYIDLRLSDGLAACCAGEADTLVCAGMGGRLMERILRSGMEKARQLGELILQPQSELPRFRAFLREAGFAVVQEDAVCEEGKYYFAMKAVCRKEDPGGADIPVDRTGIPADEADIPAGKSGLLMGEADVQTDLYDLYDRYGELLLRGRHPVLQQYLEHRKNYISQLLASLTASGSGKARGRLAEVRGELRQTEEALEIYFSEKTPK